MHHHHHLLHLLGLLGLLTTPVSAAQCPINGALLPAPRQLSTSPHVHASKQQLSAQLELALSGTLVGGWQTNATAFSIVVTDAGGDVPLWEFHHHYAANASVDVDGDTQFRVASITKVFTDLLLLKLGLGRDEPVTKYLPELAAAAAGGSPIAWDEVTLGALGDHMAAIPGACKWSLLALRMGGGKLMGGGVKTGSRTTILLLRISRPSGFLRWRRAIIPRAA